MLIARALPPRTPTGRSCAVPGAAEGAGGDALREDEPLPCPRRFLPLCGPQGTRSPGAGGRRPPVSGQSRGGTPGPVPNPEAKTPRADGTAG